MVLPIRIMDCRYQRFSLQDNDNRCFLFVNGFRCLLTKSDCVGILTRMITPEQSRAARGLLDWSQSTLANQSNLGESTIRDFEKSRRTPAINNLAAIKRAFEDAGIIFIAENGEGPGVRLAKRG